MAHPLKIALLCAIAMPMLTSMGAHCMAVPRDAALSSDPRLPDPFTFLDGKKVTSKLDWTSRREEVGALFQQYELGMKPPRPTAFTASFSSNNLTMTCTEGNKSVAFTVSISYPKSGNGPFPAIIAYDNGSIPHPPGVAWIYFDNDEIAAQQNSSSRGQGLFYELYGADATASSMMAWAWASSRIIDALEMTPAAKIDTTKIGVTGCSRDGKGALVAGAFDTRIALTIVQESGSGGAACWRLSDEQKDTGDYVQTASEIVMENVWFSTEFVQFSNDTDLLPFDHHMLAGLVAPRGLYVTDNIGFEWLGPWSGYGCMLTAKKIYQALNVPDGLGFSSAANHTHCLFPSYQVPELTAFVEKYLLDMPANTSVLRNDGNFTFNEALWLDWSVPDLS